MESLSDLPIANPYEAAPLAAKSINPMDDVIRKILWPSATKNPLTPGLEDLVTHLMHKFEEFYKSTYDVELSRFSAADVFTINSACAAVLVTKKGGSKKDLGRVIGGQLFIEQIDFLNTCMDDYRGTEKLDLNPTYKPSDHHAFV
ncbi:hypothetical protein PCANC_05945 [Puccinia coronata f. sp. avenae]|uniref:Uncharacterized protein n=1 Tax=Puccinia coronata f. sp. avenae TaxID=200324 RepID=A0A2N5VY03_9BASI|nr:hypothetical protein PCANC_05945 [Puccinia coronata f. sp. avenae]